ncbi:hypothetical protein NVIRENTERO_03129 [Sodalis praecaptivus]|nr:hypothetical protein NVIRENTERO_03129 [Sodalis praecaptivus]
MRQQFMRFFRYQFDAVGDFAYKGNPLSIADFASNVIQVMIPGILLAV